MARRLAWLIVCAAMAAGCGGKGLPKLQSVKGTLTRAGQPVGRGVILTLIPDSGEDITVNGTTDAQGRFVLRTIGPKGDGTGVPEGTYTGKVIMPMDDKQAGGQVVELLKKVEITSDTSELTLDVPTDSSPGPK